MKIVLSNNGNKFLRKRDYFHRKFSSCVSTVSTPKQNGKVERKHRHIECGTSIKVSIEFLGHFVLGTSHLINMTPCETHIFGYSLMHIIKSVIEKDLLVVVENVFLLVILMRRRGGIYLIWILNKKFDRTN